MTLLSIESLSLRLPAHAVRPVLDSVDLTIAAGEVAGLVGESGSGKSVTARAAIGLLPRGAQTAGTVRVGGVDVLSASRRELRELRSTTVSMVFQDPRAGINPMRTVGDFLTESLRYNRRADKAAARRRAVELLEAVGLPDPERHLRQHPHELSGGMLQRVMIASALTTDPELLLCDEPTTALDVTTQAEIVGILARLGRERGMGVLFITHDLDLASAVCDRVSVMYAGRIVEEASAGDLFTRPRHPYTAGLLASTPDLDGRHERLEPVRGAPLGLLEDPAGCAFRARCSFAEGRCEQDRPDLVTSDDRAVACLRADVLAEQLAGLGGGHGGAR